MVSITFLTDYTKRKSITIDYTKVSATLSNFPVLISITNDADIGGNALSTGYDIRFTSDDGTTLLYYERESFAINTGSCNAVFWVKIPSLSSTADTVIYIYYGNSEATDGETKNSTWNSNYAGVWHLNQDPSGTAPQISDSTSNGNHGTTVGSMLSTDLQNCKIGKGIHYDGSNDGITFPDSNSLDLTTAATIEAWVYLRSVASQWEPIFVKNGSLYRYGLTLGSGGNSPAFAINNDTLASGSTLSYNTWYHIVCTYDSSNMRIYVNGSQANYKAKTGNITVDTSTSVSGLNSSWKLAGSVDEIRVSNVAVSPEYVLTAYNNQNSPSSFLTLGTEENSQIYIYPIIEYNEETEMYQAPGTTESHPVQMQNLSTGAITGGTLTVIHVWYEINNGTETEWSPAPTISAFSDNMLTFKCEIPDALGEHTFVDGDKIRVAIIGTIDGNTVYGQFYVNFRTSEATLLSNILSQVNSALATYDGPTKTEMDTAFSNINVDTTGLATSTEIDEVLTAIDNIEVTATGGGSEKVIPHGSYSLDPDSNTIRLTGDYATVTLEQILSIRDITKNMDIYNSSKTNQHTLSPDPETTGLFTFTYAGDMDSEDILQIIYIIK